MLEPTRDHSAGRRALLHKVRAGRYIPSSFRPTVQSIMTRLRKTRQFCDTFNAPVEQPMLLVTDRRHILHTHKHIQLLHDFSIRQFVNTLNFYVNMLEI